MPAAQPAEDSAAQPSVEINVDQNCMIVVQDRPEAAGSYSKPHLRPDPAICHLESVHRTQHLEENVDNGVILRTRVHVSEQTFVLNNISHDPVTFVVHQRVMHGWHIDSTPQPTELADGVAVFRVVAQPGEVIHLHVGQRR
jgi:hypothetical protein